MRRHRSARAGLTLLYTGLFAGCGAVLVAVTYALVAVNLHAKNPPDTVIGPEALAKCVAAKAHEISDPSVLKDECAAAFRQGALSGAADQRSHTLAHLLGYSIATLAVLVVLAAIAGWYTAGRILRPVHQLTDAARAAGAENLSVRLALPGPRDELTELADTFDDLLSRLEAAFTAQRRFIANASHELRTPLTVMRTAVDVVLAKPRPTPDAYAAMGAEVRDAVLRAEGLIEALLALARIERGTDQDEPIDLATLAEDVLDDVAPHGVTVHTELESAAVVGDRTLLERMIANLVDNALRYNIADGTAVIATGACGGSAFVRVRNTGPHVPAEDVPRLLEPFTRLDDRTRHDGFGLGLALVAAVAERHRGCITVTADPGGGLDVVVTLPPDTTGGQPRP
jgi:signal transduction histidine kinase